MLDKDKIVVGTKFIVEKEIAVRLSPFTYRKLVPLTILRVIRIHSFPCFEIDCVHTVEGEEKESIWFFEELRDYCCKGRLRFVDPAHNETQLSGSELESKTTNDTNAHCYFCGEYTEPLMGQSRYCPKCQK